jgi:hypothetical protein
MADTSTTIALRGRLGVQQYRLVIYAKGKKALRRRVSSSLNFQVNHP